MDLWAYVCPSICVFVVFGWVTVAIIRAVRGVKDLLDD